LKDENLKSSSSVVRHDLHNVGLQCIALPFIQMVHGSYVGQPDRSQNTGFQSTQTSFCQFHKPSRK